jgi:hypothetical protein
MSIGVLNKLFHFLLCLKISEGKHSAIAQVLDRWSFLPDVGADGLFSDVSRLRSQSDMNAVFAVTHWSFLSLFVVVGVSACACLCCAFCSSTLFGFGGVTFPWPLLMLCFVLF